MSFFAARTSLAFAKRAETATERGSDGAHAHQNIKFCSVQNKFIEQLILYEMQRYEKLEKIGEGKKI